MYDTETTGARLRGLRRWRGMTLTELAGLAGVSVSFLSLVEHGHRLLARRSHIAAVASALKVSETELVGGPHLSPDRLQSDPHMGIPPLRVALQTNTLTSPAVDRARPVQELADEMADSIWPLRRACDYVHIGSSCRRSLTNSICTPPSPRTRLLTGWLWRRWSRPAAARRRWPRASITWIWPTWLRCAVRMPPRCSMTPSSGARLTSSTCSACRGPVRGIGRW